VNTLLENKATVLSPVTSVGEGVKVAVIKDPFGNAVGLIEEN
jgi:hypothetical protein